MGIIRILVILAICLGSVFSTQAQSADTPIETVNGVKCYMHFVEPGQTIYAITTAYNVTELELKKFNPALSEEGLQPDQILRIPVKEEKAVNVDPAGARNAEGFLLHPVAEGETLYSLGKQYGVKVKSFIALNPTVINGLSIGDSIAIPGTKEVVKTTTPPVIKSQPGLITHTVVAQETFYSIGHKYNVTREEIEEHNDVVRQEGLQPGQVLVLPRKKPGQGMNDVGNKPVDVEPIDNVLMVANDSVAIAKLDSARHDSVVKVAFMLPFYLDMNDTLEANAEEFAKEEIYAQSKFAIEFYQGSMLAIDSLKKQGANIEVHVFDTANDTARVRGFTKSAELVKCDLIVGPLFKENFAIISAFAKKYHIRVVGPVPQSSKVLLGNKQVTKTVASMGTQVKVLAQHVMKSHEGAKITILNTDKFKDQFILEVFQRESTLQLDTALNDSVLTKILTKFDTISVLSLIDTTMSNVVVIPSYNQSIVSQVLTFLHKHRDKCDITVYGIEKWRSFSNLDVDYLHDLNVHLTSTNFIEPEDAKVVDFKKKFSVAYQSVPHKFGYLGFDISYYFLGLHHQFDDVENALEHVTYNGMSTNFDFLHTGLESGFDNAYTGITKYNDYRLIRVK